MSNQSILILLSFLIISCGKTYKLKQDDLELQPYKVGDVLKFKSNKGEFETIKITSIDIYTNPNDPLAIFPYYYETLRVEGQISLIRPFKSATGHTFNEVPINLINLNSGKTPSLRYEFSKSRDSLSYPSTTLPLDSLKSMYIKNKKFLYNSIEIIPEEKINNIFNHDLKNFWWSKDFGYVRYEFKNGNYWELQEFIRDEVNILKN